MGNLFGHKKQSRVTEQDKAVLQLKQQRDKLRMYQKRIETQLERDRAAAKQALAKGNKEKALLLLRKKKYQESLLEKTDKQLENIERMSKDTDKQLENIERMTHDLEFAQIEVEVVNGLKAGNEALNKLHQILKIEDVERIMDETAAAVEYQREIDAALAGGLTADDEEDVLKELDDIIRETRGDDARLPDVPTEEPEAAHNLPDVPQDKIKDKERQKTLVAA